VNQGDNNGNGNWGDRNGNGNDSSGNGNNNATDNNGNGLRASELFDIDRIVAGGLARAPREGSHFGLSPDGQQ
jgi:hypothetical protein